MSINILGEIEIKELGEKIIELKEEIKRRYAEKNPSPIDIYINSNGGQVETSLVMADIIEKSEIPIHTHNLGICFSSAFSIYIAGHKRFGNNGCLFMQHPSERPDTGNIIDEKIRYAVREKQEKIDIDRIIKNTKIKDATKFMNSTLYFDYKEAKKLKIVTD